MNLLTTWITVVAVASIMAVTVQTLWDYHRARRDPYYSYDLAAAIRRHPVTHDIGDLRIPGLTDDEADEFWHAVNDNPEPAWVRWDRDDATGNANIKKAEWVKGHKLPYREGSYPRGQSETQFFGPLPDEFIQAVDSSETGDRVVYGGDTYEITKWD